MAKGVGYTIHAGWFPQLLKGSPSKKFSTSKSSRGISVKGYNRNFVEQIKSLSNERQEQLLSNPTVPTNLATLLADSGPKSYASYLAFSVMGKRKTRAISWRDMTNDATDYKNRSKAMSIRGNHIWYQLGNTGPKEMAQTLLDRPNFNFDNAESWYKKEVRQGGAQAHQEWASKTLGLHPSNVNQNISMQDVEHIGDVAEETIIKEEGLGSGDKAVAKELGMQKPASPKKSQAHGRDITSKAFGDIESTEVLNDKAHHGLPDEYIKKASDDKGRITEESWTTFMNDTVLKTWNDYTRKVIDANSGSVPKAVKQIKATKAADMSDTVGDMSLNTLRKMRHEVSIADIKEQSNDFGAQWKEGIPISQRSSKGMRDYVSSDLSLGDNLQFSLNGVNIVSGVNHTGALLATNKRELSANAIGFYVTQQNHFAHARMNNAEGARTFNGITSQGFDKATSSVKHRTNVSFSVKAGKKWLDEVAKKISKHVKDEAKMRSGKIQKRLSAKSDSYQDIFWALPYISIEEGIYKGK